MTKVAFDKSPLTSGHSIRGIGMMTEELVINLQKEAGKREDLRFDAVVFSEVDLSKYDLVHYPCFHPFFLTLPFKKSTRELVTIHDLIYLIYPNYYPPGIKGKIRFFIQKMLVKRANGILTISETSKKDIVRFLGVDPQKVYVSYLAPKKIFRKITDIKILNSVSKKYSLPQRFVLYVGDVNYNKNLLTLIRACESIGVTLVIVGKQAKNLDVNGLSLKSLVGPRDWMRYLLGRPHPEVAHYKRLLKEFSKNKKILRLGFVPNEDLVAIYNLASVYCQPSFYEGFGLPVLEAMACGVPVISSRTQALVEIVEGTALFFSPHDSKDLAEKINLVLRNKKHKDKLIENGYKNLKKFSWTKTAREIVDIYRAIDGK